MNIINNFVENKRSMSSKNIGQVEDEYNQQFLLKAQKETQCEEGKAAALGALECGGKEVGAINVVNIITNIIKEVGAVDIVNIITINIIIIITITITIIPLELLRVAANRLVPSTSSPSPSTS